MAANSMQRLIPHATHPLLAARAAPFSWAWVAPARTIVRILEHLNRRARPCRTVPARG